MVDEPKVDERPNLAGGDKLLKSLCWNSDTRKFYQAENGNLVADPKRGARSLTDIN
jgi:hypothetical protein